MGGFILVLTAGPVTGQNPLFTEVQPVFAANGTPVGHFPALKDMRSAWGDIDGDGDLDVVIMGEGPSGPVTKLFQNEGTPLTPFAFVERASGLPNLQDGAMAWGDMDNDGDLDLVMTGSVRAEPESAADLRFHVFRNDGQFPSGGWHFTEISLGPDFPGSRWGAVSWGDMDSDGDLDLFVSGDTSLHAVPAGERVQFSRIYRNEGLALFTRVQEFYGPRGTVLERLGSPVGPLEGSLTRRVTWWDFNRDGFLDLVLTTDDSGPQLHGDPENEDSNWTLGSYRQEVWIFDRVYRRYEKLGESIQGWAEAFYDVWSHTGSRGGVGDWDGDGRMDMAFFNQWFVLEDDGNRGHAEIGSDHWLLLHQEYLPGLQELPGFSHSREYGPGIYFPVVQQTSADLLNFGAQQWVGCTMPVRDTPEFKVLVSTTAGGLEENSLPLFNTASVRPRFRGVLDAVDVNRDGLLDLLHSGYDGEERTIGGELIAGARFYRHDFATSNAPPTAPTGLVAEATPRQVRFRWNPSTDALTRTEALRYAIRLRPESGRYFVQPGATADGKRLRPELDGTFHSTEWTLLTWADGNVKSLPDGTYYWSVQAIDSGGMGSAFAPEQTFTLGDPNPPADTGERSAEIPYRDAALDLGDVDGDGNLDVVLAGRTVSAGGTTIRLNHGPDSGNQDVYLFSTIGPDLAALEFGAVRWGDVDGDGDLDLAVSGRSQGQPITRVYQNNGGVLEMRNLLEGVEQSALDWGDFDNDGDLDLVVTGYRDRKPITRLYRNGGESNQFPNLLVPLTTTLTNFGAGAVAWADFDRDGDLDLLLCGDTQDYDQPLAFCTAPPVHLRPPGASYLCGSLTGRGALPKTILFRNDGLALSGVHAGRWRFTPEFTDLPPLFSYSGGRSVTARAEWCDMTGDGSPDLVLGGMTTVPGNPDFAWPSAKVFRNGGPGSALGEWIFLPSQEFLTGALDAALQTLTCADWNADGLPDILLGGWINGPGSVPTQVITRDPLGAFAFKSVPQYLRTTDAQGEKQFASGLAMFGHFNGDANVDVALSGRWGIQGSGGLGAAPTAGRIFLTQPVPANIRPTPPTDLVATVSGSGTEVTFSWGASSDGIQLVQPSYNLHVERVDGRPGGMPGMANLATGRRLVCRTGNVGHDRSWTLRNLPAGEYRWSVQAIDVGLATSEFSHAPQTFRAGPPAPPAVVLLPSLHQWQLAHPMVSAVDYLGIAAGREVRLAVGRRGQILLSRRGGLFEAVDSGVFTDLHDVIIDSEGAMVVGDGGAIRASSDGVVWTESRSGTTAALRAVAHGNGHWIAAGDGVLLRSIDRLAWTPVALPAGTVLHDVAWAQSRYVAVGGRATAKVVLTSTDGLIWNDVTPAGLLAGKITGVAGDGTNFIAVGGSDTSGGGLTYHSDILSSVDGLWWTSVVIPNEEPLRRIVASTEGWFAVRERQLVRSLDGSAWEAVFGDSFSRVGVVSVDAGRITLAGMEGLIFDAPAAGVAGSAWTQRSGANPVDANYFDFTHVEARGDTVVAVGSGGLNFLSKDGGHTWERGTNGSFNGYYGLAWGAGHFVRPYREGIESSADGVAWTKADVLNTRALAFGNGRFVAARDAGGFMVSTDGLAWNTASVATPRITDLAFGNGRFLGREAFSGNVHTSVDGLTWTLTGQVAGFGLFSFARDRFFALSAGFPAVLSSSPDGASWQPLAGVPAGAFTQMIEHRDRYILIGEPTLASADLIHWTPVPVPAGAVTAVSLTDELLVAGNGQALLFAPDFTPPLPPAAPILSNVGQPAPNVFTFTLTGSAGQVVTLERSEDLIQWIAVQTITLSGGAESLEVEAPSSRSADFFRLSWPQP